MEGKTTDEIRQMAHRVDMPEAFYVVKNEKGEEIDGFLKHAGEVGSSVSRRERVTSVARVFFDLKNYQKTLGLSGEEVDLQRGKKFLARGRFDKKVVQTDEDGFSKLVRDGLYGSESFEGRIYSYRHAEKSEYLKLLDSKLVEECRELSEVSKLLDKNGNKLSDQGIRAKRIEELGDIYEVLDAIMKNHQIQMSEINSRLQTWETVGIIINNTPVNPARKN